MKTSVPIFENFKLLKNDMQKNGWIIEAFNFKYKNVDYVVLAKLYLKGEKKPEYALLKTEIIKADDSNHTIVIPVNSYGFMTDAKILRIFFNIQYEENLKNILGQFNFYFSGFIPTQVNPSKSETLIKEMIFSLSKSDSEDRSKIYCFNVKRNSNKVHRTPFNDNKSKLLRPSLYAKFSDEPSISFCYSKDEIDEKTDEEILLNFSKRE